ncbi:MAG: ABC transporter ATP-binding protein [Acidimicrobiia bacterium]|nr:ABC transporter ATP-binding protein [Acidimicrobiia bacterium]
MSAIEVAGLVKRYGDFEAVRGVDLTIEEGEVFALLGPNGAGKTTTVEIMEGHRHATAGTVSVLGHDPAKAERSFKDRIGIVLQEGSVEDELTVREAINIHGGAYSRRRNTDELVEIVGLETKANARVGTLSGGQKRRLELAMGIVGEPDLIFLDEPTTGFDPSARREAWSAIDNLRALGKTILLTTHYMDEAQNLSDRVAVMADGRIVAAGTPESIGGREHATTRISFRRPGDVSMPFAARVEGDMVVVEAAAPTVDVHRITSWALEQGLELEELSVSRPSLEDIYLALTEDQ